MEVGAGSGVGGELIFVGKSLVDAWVWISTEGAQEMQKVRGGLSAVGFQSHLVESDLDEKREHPRTAALR